MSNINIKPFSTEYALELFKSSQKNLEDYLNNYFYYSDGGFLYLDVANNKVNAYRKPKDLIDARMPTLIHKFVPDAKMVAVYGDKMKEKTVEFNNMKYLKSPEFMERNVKRTVDLNKPLTFIGTDGCLYLNEAIKHPNYIF